MKIISFASLLGVILTASLCSAQDDLPANYDDGWYLMTNNLGPITDLPGWPLISTTNPPVQGGLTALAEAITPEISALATNLDNDPTRIFNYVHDHIRYVHYFGAHKGAQMTLLERSGNSFDQCALLVALLRGAGLTANYEFCTVSIPYISSNQADFQHWVGATMPNTNWAAIQALVGNINGQAAFPYTRSISGDTNDIIMHHVWVQLTVNGTNYTLDPSFKISVPITGINLDSATQINTNTLISDARGTATADYVQNLSESALRADLQTYNANLLAYIQSNNPNASVQQIAGGQSIASSARQSLGQQNFTIQTLNGQSPVSQWQYIPTNLMAVMIVTLPGVTNAFYSPYLGSDRLSLVCDSNGLATLWDEDTVVTYILTGGLGSTFNVTLAMQHPFGSWNFNTNILTRAAFGDQSVTRAYMRSNANYILLHAFDANSSWLTDRQRELDGYRQQGNSDSSRQVTTETLNVMGLNWLTQTELAGQLLAGQSSIFRHFHHRLGRMAEEANAGYYIDVYAQINAFAALNTTNSSGTFNGNQYFQTSGYFFSALEHGIIEQLQNTGLTAASTVKILELANTNSQTIYLANSNNWAAGANVSGNITNYSISSLSNSYIRNGYYLLLPSNGSVQIAGSGSWSGTGYVTYQAQANGVQNQAMIIGGGYNGGYVSLPGATPSTPTISLFDINQPTYINPQSATVSFPTQNSGDPVSMVDGTFQVSASDLSLGQTEPRGLNLTRYYSSVRRNVNLAGMAPGWLNSYYCNLLPTSAAVAGLGGTTPQQMAPMLVAVRAALDIYNSSQPDPKKWMMTALIAKWGIDQLINNAVSVNLGNDSIQFVRQPDGSFTSPANSTMSLIQTNTGYWLLERHGRTFKFGTNNLLANIVDQYGKSLGMTYTTSNWVHTVTDWTNRTLAFTYTGPNLTSVSDGNRTVSYGYTSGDLTSFTDAEGKTSSYVYDSNHQIIESLDALTQLIVSNTYDAYGHVTNQYTQGNTNKLWQVFASGFQTLLIDPVGGQQQYFYDERSRQTGFQDALGNLTQMFYDGQDHVVTNISPRNETNQFIYDGNNNLTTTVDPLGFTNQFLYDSQNNLIATIDPLGHSNLFGYNSQFSLATSTNGAGNGFSLAYNTDGTLHTRQDPGGTTTYGYDNYGQLNSITYPRSLGGEGFLNSAAGDVLAHTNARNITTTFKYNQRRQLTNTVGPTNLAVSMGYDAVGNLQSSKDARSNSTAYSWSPTRHQTGAVFPSTPQGTPVVTNFYDTRDWLTKSLNPLQQPSYYSNNLGQQMIALADALLRTNTFLYDPDGHLTNSTDAASETTSQTYDARGEAVTVTDPATKIVGRSYDAAGNLIYLTNRNNRLWQFQYDAANRLTNTISPTGKTTGKVFNNRGLLQAVKDALGQTTTLGYDAKGRMATNTDNVGTTTYVYDANNNLLTNSENGHALTRQYDAYDRLTSFTNGNGYVIHYGYDVNGNLTNLVYPGNLAVSYTYDSLNRLTYAKDWAGRQTTKMYDLAGELTNTARPNGTLRTNGYDAAGQITNIVERYSTGAMAIEYIALSWNNAARMQWEFVAPLPHVYTPPSRTMTYDNDNRLATFNGTSVTIDNNGNMTYGPGTNSTFGTYTYDARNRLTSAGGVTYGYDPSGNRALMTNGSVITTNVIDPRSSQLLMRIRAGVTNYYIYGAGLLYEIDTTATTTNTLYYHYDSRGSTVALTDANGNITDRMEYSAYATPTYRIGTNDTPFLYNGRYGVQTDPNGLLYMRTRYYNAYICRFLNADPSGFAGGLNMYAFADGNPISLIDPFGLGAQEGWGGATASWIQQGIVNPLNGYNSSSTPVNFLAYMDASIIGGMSDLLRLGQGTANANYNAQNGWDVAIGVSQDIQRAAGITTIVGGPATTMLGDLTPAATTSAVTSTTSGVAATTTSGQAVTSLSSSTPALVAVTPDGQVIVSFNLSGQSHQTFAQTALGITGNQLPAGAWVGTVGNVNGQIIGLNSATFYGNQLPANQAVQTALQGALRPR